MSGPPALKRQTKVQQVSEPLLFFWTLYRNVLQADSKRRMSY